MKIINLKRIQNKQLIVFDLDGTIAPTKSPMDKEMAKLIARLLAVKKVAVIGGGKYEIFKLQLLNELVGSKKLLNNLFIFPVTSTSFYRYHNGWKKVYALHLSQKQRNKIKKTFERVFEEIGYRHPKKVYGQVIEDRGSQVTFSALGQDVVAILGKKKGVFLKEKWKREQTATKMKIARLMAKYLPELEVHAAGYTSIDVTKKGIDKAYGLRQIQKYLGVKIKRMVFIGDALFPGGNDYAAIKTGVDYIPVKGPEQTKKIIRSLL